MTHKDPITINGQPYDPVTGLPITGAHPQVHHESKHGEHKVTVEPHVADVHHRSTSHHLHSSKPQRSTTLHRKSLKKPGREIVGHSVAVRNPGTTHHEVRKFAPHPIDAITPKKPVDTSAHAVHIQHHPAVVRAHAKSEAKAQSLSSHLPTASEKKDHALKKAVSETVQRKPLKSRMQPHHRIGAVLSGVFALVLLGGYLTYLNMPLISVRVAAAQAGINASYPDYRPDGYALSGPVMYTDGAVSMEFKANGGNHTFTVNQTKSAWNSDAVLDNYVAPRAGRDYIPYAQHGLTIYTFDDNAAWVNGGILYTIEGDAPLSSEQIRRIATSLL